MDNVMIERLWRSLKYECVYLQAFETGSQARTGIGGWIDYYNTSRPHSVFDGRTPEEVYTGREKRWRHENHHGSPPNERRQAVQRLGSTSESGPIVSLGSQAAVPMTLRQGLFWGAKVGMIH